MNMALQISVVAVLFAIFCAVPTVATKAGLWLVHRNEKKKSHQTEEVARTSELLGGGYLPEHK